MAPGEVWHSIFLPPAAGAAWWFPSPVWQAVTGAVLYGLWLSKLLCVGGELLWVTTLSPGIV